MHTGFEVERFRN